VSPHRVEPFRTAPLFRRTVFVSTGVVFVLAVALLAWTLSQVLLLLFAGALWGVLLYRSAQLVSRFSGLPRNGSLALVLSFALAFAVVLSWWLVPRIGDQADDLRKQIPQAVDRLTEYLQHRAPVAIPEGGSFSLPRILGESSDLVQRFAGIFSTALGIVGGAVVVLFVGLFLAVSPETYLSGFVILFPKPRRTRIRQILDRLGDTLWWWIVAQFGSMIVIGVLTGIGLAFLGVPLLFSLALLAALMTFIPNVGPIIAAIPAILLGFLESPQQALWVALMYTGVQTVEGYMITPLFQQRAISMPPALLISAQVAMAVVAGAIGLLVATPLTAVVMVLVRELYVRDVLQEPLKDSL
jgi:predicted PurR-regulated permease PerM